MKKNLGKIPDIFSFFRIWILLDRILITLLGNDPYFLKLNVFGANHWWW
jgi:hypothetical protein